MIKFDKTYDVQDKKINSNSIDIKVVISFIKEVTEIIAFFGGSVLVLYCFAVGLYNGTYFYYWDIDMNFYVQDSGTIINGLLYGLFLICILALFLYTLYPGRIFKENKIKVFFKNVFLFIIFTVVSFIFSKNNFFEYGFSLYSVFYFVFSSFIIFMLIRYYAFRFYKITYDIKQIFSNIFQFVFVLFISICATIIILGILNSILKRDYPIMVNNDGTLQTILYSTKEYYIVADCRIDGQKLIVFNDTQRKVDNYNIQLKKYKFVSVKKERFYKD